MLWTLWLKKELKRTTESGWISGSCAHDSFINMTLNDASSREWRRCPSPHVCLTRDFHDPKPNLNLETYSTITRLISAGRSTYACYKHSSFFKHRIKEMGNNNRVKWFQVKKKGSFVCLIARFVLVCFWQWTRPQKIVWAVECLFRTKNIWHKLSIVVHKRSLVHRSIVGWFGGKQWHPIMPECKHENDD